MGYFVITQITEKSDGICPYYEVKASSCELELNNRKIKIDAGNYKFYDSQFPSMSIMGKILDLCPAWSLGKVPDAIQNTYRSFDDVNESIYSFLVNDVGKAFDCILDFDIENRIINIIDLDSEIPNTDILLTYDNVLKNLDINQTTNNIVTALTLSGANDLSINEVNPLGTNYIVDFSYYKNKDWMTQELIDALNVWEKKVSDNQANFNSILSNIKQHEIELETLNSSLATLQSELQTLENEKSDLSSDGKDYSSVQAQINNKNTEITNKNAEIVSKQALINNDKVQLSNLQNSLKLENNFTAKQYSELSNFIFENDYKNEYIETDDDTTYAQKQELQFALYADGLKKLKRVCQPVSDFEIDCVNFLMIPDFNIFRDQFDLGKKICVEICPDNIVDMMVLQYEINYDSKELKIKISNQMKIHDRYTAYQEISSKAVKASNTITSSKDTWNYPVKSGKIDDFEAFRTGALNATLNKVISSTAEEISIDNTGIHGRAKDPSTGKLEKEEMWLNKNNLLFSDDNFQTAKTALGKITLPNGTVVYGLVADAIVAGTIDAGTINVINIVADNITTGTLQSANGKYSLDMETGEVNMKSGTFSGKIESATIKWTDSAGQQFGSITCKQDTDGLWIQAPYITLTTTNGINMDHAVIDKLSVGTEINVNDNGTSYAGKTTEVGITRSDGSKKTMNFKNGLFVGYV